MPAVISTPAGPNTQASPEDKLPALYPAHFVCRPEHAAHEVCRIQWNPAAPSSTISAGAALTVRGSGSTIEPAAAAAVAGTVPAIASTSNSATAADKAPQVDVCTLSRDETRRPGTVPSLHGGAYLAWKPDSVARALAAVFANYA